MLHLYFFSQKNDKMSEGIILSGHTTQHVWKWFSIHQFGKNTVLHLQSGIIYSWENKMQQQQRKIVKNISIIVTIIIKMIKKPVVEYFEVYQLTSKQIQHSSWPESGLHLCFPWSRLSRQTLHTSQWNDLSLCMLQGNMT